MAFTWTFGQEGSGLWFSITIDELGFASVEMLEGSMDLNALWFSDGDTTQDGSTTLVKREQSLAMTGSGSLDADGNPITWDEVTVLSYTGLGKEGTAKSTYLSTGESVSFELDAGTQAFLSSLSDLSSLKLGVYASSVNGGGRVTLNAIADPDVDAPVVTASQVFTYQENQVTNAVVATVLASDAVGVTQFRFANPGGIPGATTTDGYYTIDSAGNITITSEGVAVGVANNDFEVGSNNFTYGVQAGDAAGNWSEAVNISLNVTNLGANIFISVDRRGGSAVPRVWQDMNKDGIYNGSDGYVSVIKSTDYSANSFVFGTYRLDGVDFAENAVTIQFWQLDAASLDLRGFTSDDKIKLDFTKMTDAFGGNFSRTYFTGLLSNQSPNTNIYGLMQGRRYTPEDIVYQAFQVSFAADLTAGNVLFPGRVLGFQVGSAVNAPAVFGFSSADTSAIVSKAQVELTWPAPA
jgi:hypothetical protein